MKLIALERDGVINTEPMTGIVSPDDWSPVDDSIRAMASLCQAGYTLMVVQSQQRANSDDNDLEVLNSIQNRLGQLLEQYGGHVDALFFCPHVKGVECDCLKPDSGIYADIEKRFHCDVRDVHIVTNNKNFAKSALKAGAIPVFIKLDSTVTADGADDQKLNKNIKTYKSLSEFTKKLVVRFDK